MAAPTVREHRRGLEPKTKRAERAGLKVRKPNLPAESPQEQPRRARPARSACLNGETDDQRHQGQCRILEICAKGDELVWPGFPVGLGLLIVAIGASVALLHVVGVIR